MFQDLRAQILDLFETDAPSIFDRYQRGGYGRIVLKEPRQRRTAAPKTPHPARHHVCPCGAAFEKPYTAGRPAIHCSAKCRRLAWRDRHGAPASSRTCVCCGATFQIPPRARGNMRNKRHCGPACYRKTYLHKS